MKTYHHIAIEMTNIKKFVNTECCWKYGILGLLVIVGVAIKWYNRWGNYLRVFYKAKNTLINNQQFNFHIFTRETPKVMPTQSLYPHKVYPPCKGRLSALDLIVRETAIETLWAWTWLAGQSNGYKSWEEALGAKGESNGGCKGDRPSREEGRYLRRGGCWGVSDRRWLRAAEKPRQRGPDILITLHAPTSIKVVTFT